MTPPPGYVKSRDFSGFANAKTNGSFFIAELPPAAHRHLLALFADVEQSKVDFRKRGIVIELGDELTSASGEAIPLLYGSQTVPGLRLKKIIALYGGQKTVMITFQAPDDSGIDVAAIKTALASVSISGPSPVSDQLASLPFKIEAATPFRIIHTLGGSTVLLSVGTKDLDPDGLQPFALAAFSKSNAPAGSTLARTAETALMSIPQLSRIKIETREETTFAKAPGIVFTGTAEEKGIFKRFYQAFAIHEDGRTMRFLASSSAPEFGELKAAIAQTAASISFRD